MATGALFMDDESGASETEGIVHNLTAGGEEKKKRKKHFSKTKAIHRCLMHLTHYKHFASIWLAHRKGSKCELGQQAANMVAWDKFTGMTKELECSDAQKRAGDLSSIVSCESKERETKRQRSSYLDYLGIDQDDTQDYGFDLGMAEEETPMPPLNSILMEEQNKEVAAGPVHTI